MGICLVMKGMVYLKFCNSPICKNQRVVFAKNKGLYRSFLYSIQGKEFSIHDSIEIFIVIKGKITIETKYEKLELCEKDIYILNDGVAHITESIIDDNIVLALNIDKNYYYSCLNVSDTKNLYFNREKLSKSSEEINSICKELFEMAIDEEDSGASSVRLVDKLVDIIKGAIYEEEKSQKNLPSINTIFDMSKYILDTIEGGQHVEINLEELSKEFGLSYFYLSRTFKKITGLNFTDFILKLRLNKALSLLLNTDIKIIDIAYYSGFQSVKNLNNNFIKIFNISPTVLRENYSDIGLIVKHSPIYRDAKFQSFLEEYGKSEKSSSKKTDISIKNTKIINKEKWNEIVDINSIIDLERDQENLDKILQEFQHKEISIKMGIDRSSCYFLTYKGKKVEKTVDEIISFLKSFEENNIAPILMIKTSHLSLEDKERSNYIHSILEELLKAFGQDVISKYTFGIELEEMDSLILNRQVEIIENQIKNFKNVLKEVYGDMKYNFAVNLGVLDDRLLEILSDEKDLFLDADYYFIKINNEFSDDVTLNEGEKIISQLNRLMDLTGVKSKESLLIYMNYIYNFDSSFNYSIVNFFPVYRIIMWIEFLTQGYSIVSSNALIMNDGHLESYYSYFFNNLGVRLPSYYINKLFKQLGNEVVYFDKGKFITKNKDDFIMVLFDDIRDKKLLREVGPNQREEMAIKLENIYGVYKVSEYKIKYNSKRFKNFDIQDNDVTEEELTIIENGYSPDLAISFVKANGRLNYSVRRNIFDVHFISFEQV